MDGTVILFSNSINQRMAGNTEMKKALKIIFTLSTILFFVSCSGVIYINFK